MALACMTAAQNCENPEAGSFALLDAAPAVARIDELGLVRVSGKDAVHFLHGQFTNAVEGLGTRTITAGYCSPKGRLLASVRLWMAGDDVMMLLPKAVAPQFLKRLRMYVLRADVHFDCAMEGVSIFGVVKNTAETLTAAGLAAPAEGEALTADGVTVLDALPAAALEGFGFDGRRAIVIAPSDRALFAGAGESALWWASEIAAGTATVWPGSRELFVPQAVNFELTGGVVFNKGCYPGQEVISRVQHIGEIGRRAAIGVLDGAERVLPGAPVYAGEKEAGFVVQSVIANGRTLGLFSALCAALVSGVSLQPGGAVLTQPALPYKIRNVLK